MVQQNTTNLLLKDQKNPYNNKPLEQSFIDDGVLLQPDETYLPNDVPVQSMQDFWTQYSAISNTEGNIFDASYIKLR